MATTKAGQAETGRKEAPRFTELIPHDTNIDFVRFAPTMIALSWVVILAGLLSIWMRGGLNYGIDFAGGTFLHVKFPQAVAIGDIRTGLARPEIREGVVQDVGGTGEEFQIRVLGNDPDDADAASVAAKAGLQEKFGEGSFELLRTETVGPKVGSELWRDATLAVLISTVLMGIYLWFRFDVRFGIGAAVALLHDVLITVAFISFFNVEFDLTTIAALLTVVGFSVNDTVIISDRIRENFGKMRRESLRTILNKSVNETLSRTIINSGTAILVTMALFFLGGPVIHSFAFALLVGFTVGTYSSIYVSSPIILYLENYGAIGRQRA